MTLAGQVHGGVAQGAGQALMEQVVYDPESGQLLSASRAMDYAMPHADEHLYYVSIVSNPSPNLEQSARRERRRRGGDGGWRCRR